MAIKVFFLLLLLSGSGDRESLRFSCIAEQGFDTSCGLSVLASLMEGYWGRKADEFSLAATFFSDRLAKGDLTVSFADMAAILKVEGFACKAYQMSYEQLENAIGKYAPVVVHYDKPEGHFAMALAVREGELLIADPAEGAFTMGRRSFESRWSGKVLVAVLPGGTVDSALLAKAKCSVWGRGEFLDRVGMARVGAMPW